MYSQEDIRKILFEDRFCVSEQCIYNLEVLDVFNKFNDRAIDVKCNIESVIYMYTCQFFNISDTPPPTPLPSLVSCDGSAPIGIGLSCYYISGLDTKTWPEASYVCEKKGMELASFHSVAEMNVIIQKFQNYQPQPGEQAPRFPENIWIGMTKGFSGKEQEYPTKSSIKCT